MPMLNLLKLLSVWWSCNSILILRNIHWNIQAEKAVDICNYFMVQKKYYVCVCTCMCVDGAGTEREYEMG